MEAVARRPNPNGESTNTNNQQSGNKRDFLDIVINRNNILRELMELQKLDKEYSDLLMNFELEDSEDEGDEDGGKKPRGKNSKK